MQTTYRVGDFTFTDERAAAEARKELKQIEHLRPQIDMKDRAMVLKVYKQIVAKGIFHTPVGYAFTNELREIAGVKTAPAVKVDNLGKEKYKRSPHTSLAEAEAAKAKEEGGDLDPKTKKLIATLKRQVESLKKMNLALKVVVAILIACVVGMFIINSTTNNVNILNYEEEIIDKYSQWDEELTQRELELKMKENQYQ